MKSEVRAMKPAKRQRKGDGLKWLSRLQVRMTISYIAVTVVIVLLLELLVSLIIAFILTHGLDIVVSNTAQQTAHAYALEAAIQAGGTGLDPHSTFQPGRPSSIALPEDSAPRRIPFISDGVTYTDPRSHPSHMLAFALLIAPDGQVLASSYPAQYPVSTLVTRLLPQQTSLILNALAGRAGSTIEDTAQGHVVSAVEPVWSRAKQPIGAIYVQMPTGVSSDILWSVVGSWLRSGPGWVLLLTPFGAIFGVLTTRGLVRRIHQLVKATAQFASGDYTQRVPITRQDEIGQLERQFNQMAEQLVESIAQQQRLTEQHARLEERARIEQEMRTAQYIQRTLLPKEVPPLSGWQLAPFYRPAREVGGDFYDFLPLEDGRLGLVIGDVTDKGVPAALVMATTCTMIRAAAQGATPPGEVLARVNDLLYTNIPSGMFATCFYGILDPGSGQLRFANAGHDLPYKRHYDQVCELRATGMPLGLMPGTRYEEQEATVAPDECILFYSDGLVEAHNPGREMFGFPRLKTLLGEHSNGIPLIDFLLDELKHFTGEAWEQEDDVTLVTLQRDV
jgi:serine phosphatase RsbU (regulator of sigma subunit)